MIQLTDAERTILEQVEVGYQGVSPDSSSMVRMNLNLLLELQLVVESPEGLRITRLGSRVLKLARRPSPRA